MGMRFRRSNRANHPPYSPNIQLTALILSPLMWIPILLIAGTYGWSAAIIFWVILLLAVWIIPQ